MWIAEFKVWHQGSQAIELTKKYDATVRIYLLNVFAQRQLGVSKVMTVVGSEWRQYIRDLVRLEKRIHFSRVEGNQVFYSYLQPRQNYASVSLEKDVFFLKPITISKGFEYWTLASWDKKKLAGLPKKASRRGSRAVFKLVSIKKETPMLFVSSAAGSLSKKQLEAFQSAVEQGYYSYPRKIALPALAKLLGVSKSTLREHLRVAEAKLMPATASQIGRIA